MGNGEDIRKVIQDFVAPGLAAARHEAAVASIMSALEMEKRLTRQESMRLNCKAEYA